MREETRKYLEREFAADNAHLAEILGWEPRWI
jgi:hypothetical protein